MQPIEPGWVVRKPVWDLCELHIMKNGKKFIVGFLEIGTTTMRKMRLIYLLFSVF
jgi:hypothetical protein